MQEGKTAYLAVDAFRFEMARELSEAISGEFSTTLDAAIATVPTITRIGMAALLPNAEKRFTVMPKSGKLAVEIDGVTVRERADRIDYLKKNAGVVVFETKLEDLLPKPKKKKLVRDSRRGGPGVCYLSGNRFHKRGRHHNACSAHDG